MKQQTETERPSVMHTLKIWPEFIDEIISGKKTFEVRHTDEQGYREGDALLLKEWLPDQKRFTGRAAIVDVTYASKLPVKVSVGPIFLKIAPLIVMSIKLREVRNA